MYLHVARLSTVSHGVADGSALVMLATLNTRPSEALLNLPVGLWSHREAAPGKAQGKSLPLHVMAAEASR